MAKSPVVDPLTSLANESSAVAKINLNAQRAADAIAKALSTTDTTENTMNVPLDMNSQRIINLPAPTQAGDPIRYQDREILRGPQGIPGSPGSPGIPGGVTDTAAIPLTPYDFIPDPLVRRAISTGIPLLGQTELPDSTPYIQAWLTSLITSPTSLNRSVEGYWGPGHWVVDKKIFLSLSSSGKYNGLHIRFAGPHVCKIIYGPNNKYRFVNKGFWNAATNTPTLTETSGVDGDTYTVKQESNARQLGGTTFWAAGDRIHKKNGVWQKILAPARWRGYVDPNTNYGNDGPGTLMIWPEQAEYGDFYICKNYGIFYGTEFFAGDEIYFLGPGNFVKKSMIGGNFKGVWNPNNSGPPAANPVIGDYYIASTTSYEGNKFGEGTLASGGAFISPGDKLWWTGETWRKVYCVPTPRGSWDAVNGQYNEVRWYSSSNSYQNNVFTIASGKGGYGDWLYSKHTGSFTVDGISSWQEDEVLYFTGAKWEKVLRDPNYDSGILHISFDNYKNNITFEGGCDVISKIDTRPSINGVANPNLGYVAGPAIRVYSRNSAINNAGLNGETTLRIQGMRVLADSADVGEAQFYQGVVESCVETRNIYVPILEDCEFRPPVYIKRSASDIGTDAMVNSPTYPRVAKAAVYHEDAYVPRFDNCQANGRWGTGFYCDSVIHDIVNGASWEGGRATRMNIAENIDGIRLQHRYRNEGATEPQFEIDGMDGKALRYGVRIYQHNNVQIDNWGPILEDFVGNVVTPVVAALCIEGGYNIVVNGIVPTGGFNASNDASGNPVARDTLYATSLLTYGPCGNIRLNGCILGHNGIGVTPRHYSPLNTYITPSIIVSDWSDGGRIFSKDFKLCANDQLGFVYDEGQQKGTDGRYSVSKTARTSVVGSDPRLLVKRLRSDYSAVQAGVTLGSFEFVGWNSAANEVTFGSIESNANTVTSGQEKGNLDFRVPVNGTLSTLFTLDGFSNIVRSRAIHYFDQRQRLATVVYGNRYASDSAAASGGIPVGDEYVDTNGFRKVRLA